MGKLFIRTDGNSQLGLGHVMRCIALSDMLKHLFDIVFFIKAPLLPLQLMITRKEFLCVPIEVENDFLSSINGDEIVILDGYEFDAIYQMRVKRKGCALVCIDDLHDRYFSADAIINPAPGVTSEHYDAEPHTRFLLGPEYSLLRPLFLKQAKQPREIQCPIKTVLICFGGADHQNLTVSVLRQLLNFAAIEQILVITGMAYSHQNELNEVIKLNFQKITQIHAASERQMLDGFLSIQLAIVPASGILFEAIACKTPVVSGYYTSNQLDIYHGFRDFNVFFDAKGFDKSDLQEAIDLAMKQHDFKTILSNQQRCIDGQSSDRYVDFFKNLVHARSAVS